MSGRLKKSNLFFEDFLGLHFGVFSFSSFFSTNRTTRSAALELRTSTFRRSSSPRGVAKGGRNESTVDKEERDEGIKEEKTKNKKETKT